MAEFFKAAFPWIVIGIALAVFAVYHVNRRKKAARRIKPVPDEQSEKSDRDEQKSEDTRMTEGMCIGMCMGVMLGTTGVFDLATGISLGMLLGMVIGMCIKK